MSVKQAAEYLQVNEKKIYALASSGLLPGTKVTGKWLFPRHLVDQWLLESSHGGVLTDRLLIGGSDDPLLARLVGEVAAQMGSRALVGYSATGTRLGLELLAAGRIDVAAIHWGPEAESGLRHPALLQSFPAHSEWIIVRAFRREQGLVVAPRLLGDGIGVDAVVRGGHRWALRQEGAGSQRFLLEILARHGLDTDALDVAGRARSEREAASLVASGAADVAPGPRAAAGEFGLAFVTGGWEAFDLALAHRTYFRSLFRRLLEVTSSPPARTAADRLGGYDLDPCGDLVWSAHG